MPPPNPSLPFETTFAVVVEFSPTGILIRPHGGIWCEPDQPSPSEATKNFTSLPDFVAWFRDYYQIKT